MAAGSIVIDLLLNTGSFETDTGRAAKALRDLQTQTTAVGVAMGEFLKEGFDKALEGLQSLTIGTLEANEQLLLMSKNSGVAADTLGGLGFAASQVGGNLDDTAASIGKLNKSIAQAGAGNPAAADAFAALGISVKDAAGNMKSADDVFLEVADKFQGFADGPNKAAIALQLFGRAGAAQIALLDQGGDAIQNQIDYYKRFSGVTQDTLEASEKFSQTLGDISLINKSLGQTILAEVLPVVQKLAEAFLDAKENGTLFQNVADSIRITLEALIVTGRTVKDTFLGVGDALGAAAALANTPPDRLIGAVKAIGDSWVQTGKDARAAGDQFAASILKAPDNDKGQPNYSPFGSFNPKPQAPTLPIAGDALNAAKKQLDAALKQIEDFEKSQLQAVQYGQSALAVVYSEGLESQDQFFADQKALRDAALTATVQDYTSQIQAQQKFLATPGLKPADIIAGNQAITLARQKRSEAVIAAAQADALAELNNAKAAESLQVAYANLQGQILAAKGNDAGAQAIKDAQALKTAAILISQADGNPALLGELEQIQTLQATRAQQQKDYAKLLQDQQNIEATIYLDAEAAGTSELATLAKVRDARTQALAQLQQQAQAAADLAKISGTDADQAKADALALSVKKAASQLDPLATKFNTIFEDGFSNAFAGFLAGTQTAKQAFSSFAQSVIGDMAKIASQQLAKSIFGDVGGSSGIGGFFSGLFKGSPGQATNNTGTSLPTAGGAATGTNFVERDLLTIVHRGEAIVPKAYNPAAGGAGGVQIHNYGDNDVSATTDQSGQVQVIIQKAANLGHQKTAADLARGTGIASQGVRNRFGLGAGNLAKRR